MTVEELKKELAALIASKEQAVAQINAIIGAIQVCEKFITAMEAKEE